MEKIWKFMEMFRKIRVDFYPKVSGLSALVKKKKLELHGGINSLSLSIRCLETSQFVHIYHRIQVR